MSTLSIVFLALLVLLLAAAAVLLIGRRRPAATAPAPAAAASPAAPAEATPAPAAVPAPPAALPEALRAFRPVAHESLPPAQVAALVQRLAQIPPPPLALHRLVSTEFLEAARPTVLAEMIMAEAQIAARLLATVNAPKYGLRKPVGSVVQAVSLLGLNTVRSLCLQHLLHNSFASAGPAHRQRLDRLLHASTLSSELCGRLAVALQLPEAGALVTQCVLSFLGQLAGTVLLQPGSAAWGPHGSLLARLDAEQQALGLASDELGALLMQAWGLPASIVAEVRDIHRVLLTPAHLVDPRHAPRLALCHLCTLVGERLAQGQLQDLAALRLDAPDDPDLCHLAGYLALPALAGLGGLLQPGAPQAPRRQAQGSAAQPA
ncbi:MAG: HDOD domain-containing protein [Pseudomonadota bacterium]